MYSVDLCEHMYLSDGVSASMPYHSLFKGTLEECHDYVVKNKIIIGDEPEEYYGEPFVLTQVNWTGESDEDYEGEYWQKYPAYIQGGL